ncbi:metalloreductase transmembrane component [Beauveria bassiana ARSEF 2860]|uniref:Metalloreductase transmembrane component n=1 Tax=Beauveria bassiana (strain ARSEF 2860) TaxID=655819 RepID=J4KKV0_BEAB2|nr:metalloreductase transmembrane component [Beauveria bassiana ARSEF 2860]EJP61089.1 metalloreductase transmembrane component [Beauveria bassiana ARSEF 2860]
MTDSSNTSSTSSPSMSTNAKDISVHRCSIREAVQAFMHGITHNQAEVAACVAAYPDSVPLIYSVLPTTEPGNLPTPPAQPLGLEAYQKSTRDKQKPDNAYKRAVAIADKLPLELGSVNVLSELQHDLQRERARTDYNAQQRRRANPEPRSQSEDEAGNHSENLEDDYHSLQPSPRFETATGRYWSILIAQRYRAAKQSKEKHIISVAEKFAKKYLPDNVKKGLSKKKLQTKWKAIMHQHNFWEQMATSCGGAGVLLLLPAEFQNEHARRLKIEDKAALFASIAARHPNLKHDVAVLTDLLSCFLHNKALPKWQIPLETLSEAEIATRWQRGLRELVVFVDSPVHITVDGEDAARLPSAQPLSSLMDSSMCDYGYKIDQDMECMPLSPANEQRFIPPGSDAVLEGLGFDINVTSDYYCFCLWWRIGCCDRQLLLSAGPVPLRKQSMGVAVPKQSATPAFVYLSENCGQSLLKAHQKKGVVPGWRGERGVVLVTQPLKFVLSPFLVAGRYLSGYLTYPTVLNRRNYIERWSCADSLLLLAYVLATGACVAIPLPGLDQVVTRTGTLSVVNLLFCFAGPCFSTLADVLNVSLHSCRRLHASLGTLAVVLAVLHAAVGGITTEKLNLQTPKDIFALVIRATLPKLVPSVSLCSFAQTHPFVVTSWSEKPQKYLDLFIAPHRGFTKDLLTLSEHGSTTSIAWLSGPHGKPLPLDRYENIVMLATESGVAAHLPYLKQLTQDQRSQEIPVRRVHLIWQMERRDVGIAAQKLLNETLTEGKLNGQYSSHGVSGSHSLADVLSSELQQRRRGSKTVISGKYISQDPDPEAAIGKFLGRSYKVYVRIADFYYSRINKRM